MNNKSIQEILCGDSFYVLKNHFSKEYVDIIITSPPYNAAHKYDCYNDDLEFTHYLDSMKAIFSECYRVLKIGGRICVNVPFAVKNKESKEVRFLSVHIMQILNTIGFKEFELITWHKGKDIRHFQGNNTAWGSWKSPSCPSFRPLGEAVLVFYKESRIHKKDPKTIDISAEEFKAWTKNIWYFDKDLESKDISQDLDSKNYIDTNTMQIFPNVLCVSNNAKKDLHPAPYPEELIERLLKLYSYKEDIVLDPFLGTGTTALVAKNLQRNFIGIDLSKNYCNIALQRLQENNFIKSFSKDFENLVNSNDNDDLSKFFPYKEAFSPKLLNALKQRYVFRTESIYDPFCGLGSSFMDSSLKECYGFDTNPLAFHITKVKLTRLDLKALSEAKKIAKSFKVDENFKADFPKWQPFGKYAESKKYSIIMDFIQRFSCLDSEIFHFMKYLVIVNLSAMLDYKRDGNGIKYRKSKIIDLESYLKDLSLKALEAKADFDKNNDKSLYLQNESCIKNTINAKVDCILTSPPYANLFDYFEIYKMELFSSGLVKTYEDWRSLKKTALRNNKNARLDSNDSLSNSLLETTLEKLKGRELDKNTITMLQNYFYDMQKVMEKCYNILKNGGYFFIVVGNSSYKGVPIRADEILAQEAVKLGFICEEIIIARKLNTSSQQMRIMQNEDIFYLRESIIVLRNEYR